MHRILTASVLGVLLVAAPVMAADADQPVPALTLTAAALATASTVSTDTPAVPPPDFTSSIIERYRRPGALPALYVASAALQGYDAYSTMSALNRGAVEANPLMKNVVKSPVAFVALKATVAATSIMAAEKLWKGGNRIGAIGVMVASNVAMGFVAAHNARVLSTLQ